MTPQVLLAIAFSFGLGVWLGRQTGYARGRWDRGVAENNRLQEYFTAERARRNGSA